MPNEAEAGVVYLGLGSNLGDRLAAMRAAVRALDDHPRIRMDFEDGLASLYETSPVGGPADQGAYLNSAIRVFATLAPRELLDVILSIERTLGRVRRQAWEARVIDIDLLLYDDLIVSDDGLSLPHPRLHERRFVLEPLAEIAGEVVHPVLKLPISELARRARNEATDQRVTILAGPTWSRAPDPLSALL